MPSHMYLSERGGERREVHGCNQRTKTGALCMDNSVEEHDNSLHKLILDSCLQAG